MSPPSTSQDKKQRTTLSLLACQISIPETASRKQRDEHLERSSELVRSQLQLSQKTDLVVLPELSTIDYSRQSFDALIDLVETDHGPSFDCWSAVARENQCAIVYGFPRRVNNGFRISSAVVSANGELEGIYDKIHLAQFGDSMEKEYFNSAGQQLLVFNIAGFRVATIICYDIRFPELCRQLVLQHKVDLILHVGAYARDSSFYSWHAFATTRAVENQCFFLSLNRAGAHFGHSIFCEPWIDESHPPTLFSEHEEECRRFVLSMDTLDKARIDYSFLSDRLNGYDLPIA